MSLGNTYNSNENKQVCVTYSPVSFANSESKVSQTKLNISYFNRLLKVGIANKEPSKDNNQYETYDNKNQAAVYLSFTKAKILHDLIVDKLLTGEAHNVAVDMRNGLLEVCDGSEFGIETPCIVIRTTSDDGISTSIYETKKGFYKGVVNYNVDDSSWDTVDYDNIELDVFIKVLEEYYAASMYATAATVIEANYYNHNFISNRLNAIAEKVGAINNNGGGNYSNNSTFLQNNGGNRNSSSGMNTGASNTQFEASSFDDIARSMQ